MMIVFGVAITVYNSILILVAIVFTKLILAVRREQREWLQELRQERERGARGWSTFLFTRSYGRVNLDQHREN